MKDYLIEKLTDDEVRYIRGICKYIYEKLL